VIDCFVDIGGIDDHYCLPPISAKQTISSHLHSLNTKKESLNSNGHQFHQYQQNK
jgi:hypothetical protein